MSKDGSIHSSALVRMATIKGKVTVAEECRIVGGVALDGVAEISIGRYTSLNGPNTDIHCAINSVKIGAFCSIARGVAIQEFNHKFKGATSYLVHKNLFGESKERDLTSSGRIEIGNDVWIGAQCVILGGANIGHGVVVGANSVVSGNIPDYAIAVGSPAKVIGYRFDEPIISALLELKWWDWSVDEIKSRKAFFDIPELTLDIIRSLPKTKCVEAVFHKNNKGL